MSDIFSSQLEARFFCREIAESHKMAEDRLKGIMTSKLNREKETELKLSQNLRSTLPLAVEGKLSQLAGKKVN